MAKANHKIPQSLNQQCIVTVQLYVSLPDKIVPKKL